jgi:cell division transport system permease protein
VRALDYALRQGWAGLVRSRGASVLAVLAIALAMSVLGALLVVSVNAGRILDRWHDGAEFSVYLRDDATEEQRGMVEAVIDQSAVVEGRAFVSKDDALVRFRTEFAELASLAAELPGNPFPASLEVRLRDRSGSDTAGEALLRRVATLPGVSDVRYDRVWLARVDGALATLRQVGFGLVLLLATAAALTVASVVRLGMQARRDEIEIMELVGASAAFIRGPFVAEGLLQGGIGAGLAALLVYAGYRVGLSAWGESLSQALGTPGFQFLPPALLSSLVAGGMLVGAVGGLVASRR